MSEADIILGRLRKLAARDNRPAAPLAEGAAASTLFTFVTRERERIAGCAFVRTSIVVIIEGAKELVVSGRQKRYPAGTALVLPGGWRGDVVNDPDPATGHYRAVFIDFSDALVDRVRRSFVPRRTTEQIAVSLDPMLSTAIHHAGEGISAANLPPALVEHRVMEVLMVLGLRGALPAKTATTGDAIRDMVRWQPDRQWTADTLAAALGTSNATLRRRLAEEGTSLRSLLADIRVTLVNRLIAEDGHSLQEAALAAGYRSARRLAARMKVAGAGN